MDATAIRREIKAWERSFKVQNTRDATIDDIKAHPEIGVCVQNALRYRYLTRSASHSGEIQAL